MPSVPICIRYGECARFASFYTTQDRRKQYLPYYEGKPYKKQTKLLIWPKHTDKQNGILPQKMMPTFS